LKAVQIITRKQDGNGVQLKLHQMTDTFPGIGESVQILMFATLMKDPINHGLHGLDGQNVLEGDVGTVD